jgi:uncharacterized membrane protein
MLYDFDVKIPRIFYAVALIGLGIQHYLFRDFIMGRAPVFPEGVPGKLVFAYVTGGLLVANGLAILLGKNSRWPLVISGILILSWAALRNIIALVYNLEYGGLLTNTFKGLALGFGAYIVAMTFPTSGKSLLFDKSVRQMSILGNYAMGMFLLIGGIQHFIFADFVNFLVPSWLPFIPFWTYFAGVALIAAGLGIITGIQRNLASWWAGVMVLIWVLILHLPRAFANQNQNEWSAVFEALAVSGLLLIMAQNPNSKYIAIKVRQP